MSGSQLMKRNTERAGGTALKHSLTLSPSTTAWLHERAAHASLTFYLAILWIGQSHTEGMNYNSSEEHAFSELLVRRRNLHNSKSVCGFKSSESCSAAL